MFAWRERYEFRLRIVAEKHLRITQQRSRQLDCRNTPVSRRFGINSYDLYGSRQTDVAVVTGPLIFSDEAVGNDYGFVFNRKYCE